MRKRFTFLNRSTIRGSLIVAGGNIIGKSLGILSQILLGWILTKEDYGLFAIVISIGAVVNSLNNNGTAEYLVQRSRDFERQYSVVTRAALLLAVVATSCALLIGGISAAHFGEPSILIMLALICVAFLVSAPGRVLQAKLLIDQQYNKIAKMGIIVQGLRHSLSVLLALAGFGAYSLAIPAAAHPLLIAIFAFLYVGVIPRRKEPILRKEYCDVFGAIKWIVIAAIAMAFLSNGRYFVISLYESKANLGVFFFSMQLVQSIRMIFQSTNSAVVFPALSKILDTELLDKRFNEALVVSVIFGFLMAITGYATSSAIIHVVWDGKWDDASNIIQWLVMLWPSHFVFITCLSMLKAKGAWSANAISIALMAGGDLIIVFVAARYFDTQMIAATIAIYHTMAVSGLLVWSKRYTKTQEYEPGKIIHVLIVGWIVIFVATLVEKFVGTGNESISLYRFIAIIPGYIWLVYQIFHGNLSVFRTKFLGR